MGKAIVSLFILGLAFGSGPCLASCGPLLISFIAGTQKNIPKALSIYGLFSLSRIAVYIFLSLAIFFLGKFAVEGILNVFSRYVFIIGGVFVVLIGTLIALGKRIEFKALRVLQQKVLERDKKSTVAFGMIIGLLPCAPLLAILSYIGLISKSWVDALLYGLSFGLGTFCSPLILLSMITGVIPRFFAGRKDIYFRIFSFVCGLIIIFLGIQLIKKGFINA